MQRLSFFISFFSIIIISTSWGQSEQGKITGRVTTAEGTPIYRANVFLKDIRKQTTTDTSGTYSFEVKEGKYSIIVSHVGFKNQQQNVSLAQGQVITADFILSENTYQSDEIVINAGKTANEKSLRLSKIPVALIDLPQSGTVIEREVLEQQQILRLSEAVKNVPGVYHMSSTGGHQEEIGGRGFSYGSSNTFKNGIRFNNLVMPEMSSLERIEILKGSSAILFGNVAPGGVINLVTKKPVFMNGGEVTFRAGSYNFYKPTVDVYGRFLNSDIAAYRVNTSYEKGESFRDNVSSERFYINPSFKVNLGDKTEFLIEGDFLKDMRTVDFGTAAINYEIADLPRNRFLGISWASYKAEQKTATATLTHHLNDTWQIRGIGGYQKYANDFFGHTRPNTGGQLIQPDGKLIRGVQRGQTQEEYYLAQLDLTGNFETGFLKHHLLTGIEADKYNTSVLSYNAIPKYDSINVFDLNMYKQRHDIPELSRNTLSKTPINRAGVYIQDLIDIFDNVKFLAGLRWSYQETVNNVYNYLKDTTITSANFDDAITPRFGIVYQPLQNISLFASYANSFTLNSGVDISGNALPPSYIDQYEAGFKTDLLEGLLSANITLYQIINSNFPQTDLTNNNTNANIKELTGEVTSKGIEAEIISKPWNGITLMAGYSFNQATYTKSNTYIEGSQLLNNPNHTGNFGVHYIVIHNGWMNGLNFGLNAFYMGDRLAGRSTRVTVPNDSFRQIRIPGFTQLDISAGYSYSSISMRLQVLNLTNELSYFAKEDFSINPIAPRMITATLSYQLN